MNTITIICRLTADPEVKIVGQGEKAKAVATFTVAVDNRFNDEASFFDVNAWGKTAEVIANHVTKGQQIGITGRLEQQRWEKDGQKRSKVIIVCDGFSFCGKKEE